MKFFDETELMASATAQARGIFHYSAELVYRDLTAHHKEVRKEDLEALLKNDVKLQSYVDNAFKEKFFHVSPTEQPEY